MFTAAGTISGNLDGIAKGEGKGPDCSRGHVHGEALHACLHFSHDEGSLMPDGESRILANKKWAICTVAVHKNTSTTWGMRKPHTRSQETTSGHQENSLSLVLSPRQARKVMVCKDMKPARG